MDNPNNMSLDDSDTDEPDSPRSIQLQRLRPLLTTANNMSEATTHCSANCGQNGQNVLQAQIQPNSAVMNYITQREHLLVRRHPPKIDDYVARKLPGLLKEKEIHMGDINKIFASQWISDYQIVFGTKCNKLFVLNLKTNQLAHIQSLLSSPDSVPADCPCGIHAIAINPSQSLLATGASNTNDVGIYKLPSFDPACVGEFGHSDWIFDMTWLDDQYLLTGSRDTKLCLWRIVEDDLQTHSFCDALEHNVKHYDNIKPLSWKKCRQMEKIRALAYNKQQREVATLSLNATVHFWDLPTFAPKASVRLRNQRENVCMCLLENNHQYAVGSQSHVTIIDPRSPKDVTVVSSKQRGQGIRSLNNRCDILSIGTGAGAIFFFDIRAGKYLEMNCGHAVSLNTSKGFLLHDETYQDFFLDQEHPNAIYTHQYDSTRSRLFVAGGPLPAGLWGNYAGIWH